MKQALTKVKGFYENSSLGISANQIGIQKRIILVSRYPSTLKLRKHYFDAYINPEVIEYSTETNFKWEGCLSEPE